MRAAVLHGPRDIRIETRPLLAPGDGEAVVQVFASGLCGTDYVTDTPNAQLPNYGKPKFPHITCNNGPNGDMFMDYMDYVDDAAMFMFTAMIGSAEFLLPDGSIVPASRWPPSTMYWMGGTGARCLTRRRWR